MRALLLLLALGVLHAHAPRRMPGDVRTAAMGLRLELDPRRMCARELRQLPGLGPALAAAALVARDGHRAPWPLFWENVPGIGPVRAARIRAWLRERGIVPEPLAHGRFGAGIGYAPRVDRLWLPVALALAPFFATCREASVPGDATEQATEHATGGATASVERAPPGAPGAEAIVSATEVRTRALLGGALHALEAGPQDGAPVLLLHGGRYSARNWLELGTLALLAGAGHRAVAIDWPGHGQTAAWAEEPSARTLLARLCDELGPARVVLIGPSLGGGFALEFAAADPARVAGLIAIAPAGAARFAPERFEVPTLLLWGERDEILPLEVGRALAERLPDARLELFPGAGHACYIDEPGRFHELLLGFLAIHAARPEDTR